LDLQKKGNASKVTATTSTSTPAYGTVKKSVITVTLFTVITIFLFLPFLLLSLLSPSTSSHPPPTYGTTTTKKSRLRKTGKCNLHSRRLERGFAERALGAMRDIEELAALGHDLGAYTYTYIHKHTHTNTYM
jgi:hypothetical protein